MYIFAHRGYSSRFPENTMIAFEIAIESGCDGIETDVQLTSDGEVVITHDENIERVSDGKGLVCEHTLEELKALSFSRKFPELPPQRIPLLSELLELLKKHENVMLNIELKNSEIEYKGLEEKVLKIIDESGIKNRILFSSFNHDSMVLMNKLRDGLLTAPLFEDPLEDADRYAVRLGVTGLHPSVRAVLKMDTEAVLKEGRYINVYTVNDTDLALRLKKMGVSGIFTDRCREMKEFFEEKKS